MKRKTGGASESRAYKASRDAYGNKGSIPEGMEVIGRTKTATAYRDPATGRLLFGLRGTADARDVLTDLTIPFNGLTKTRRYRADKEFVDKILAQHPGAKADLAGHSLGGTIASQLKRDLGDRAGDVDTFNQAMQPMDYLKPAEGTKRRYIQGDPLHAIMGQFGAKSQTEVRDKPSTAKKPFWGLPGLVKTGLNYLNAHSLENFDPAGTAAQAAAPAQLQQQPQQPQRSNDPLDAFGLAPRSGGMMSMY